MAELLDLDLVLFMAACEAVVPCAPGITASAELGPERHGAGAFLVTFRLEDRYVTIGIPRTLSEEDAQAECAFGVERLLAMRVAS